jgi:hypothetical protein
MLFIVFGTKVKTETVGDGEFYCPSCQAQRKYLRKRAKNYFALYFVALFPIAVNLSNASTVGAATTMMC